MLLQIVMGTTIPRSSRPEVFLEISQNSQENTCARASFLIKESLYQKRGSGTGCFPVNYAKFLRTPFFKKHFWWLLLDSANKGRVFRLPKTS